MASRDSPYSLPARSVSAPTACAPMCVYSPSPPPLSPLVYFTKLSAFCATSKCQRCASTFSTSIPTSYNILNISNIRVYLSLPPASSASSLPPPRCLFHHAFSFPRHQSLPRLTDSSRNRPLPFSPHCLIAIAVSDKICSKRTNTHAHTQTYEYKHTNSLTSDTKKVHKYEHSR